MSDFAGSGKPLTREGLESSPCLAASAGVIYPACGGRGCNTISLFLHLASTLMGASLAFSFCYPRMNLAKGPG